tara:strand:- start:226 stop:438 length:213 start_codon:yes stop_codon:yes gene_type:complete
MILDHNTFGPPTKAQNAAHVSAIRAVVAAGFTPFTVVSYVQDGFVNVSSVETAPNTMGHPAFQISVGVKK